MRKKGGGGSVGSFGSVDRSTRENTFLSPGTFLAFLSRTKGSAILQLLQLVDFLSSRDEAFIMFDYIL